MNPLQALLNSIVYRDAGGWVSSRHLTRSNRSLNHVQDMMNEESTETSALLAADWT